MIAPANRAEKTRFGELLRGLRTAAGLSQESLAELARISVQAVSTLERGTRRSPHPETLQQLATALSLSSEGLREFRAAAEQARYRGTQRSGAISAASSNFPPYSTSFVVREDEVSRIRSLLATHRLITICGAGGVGKTRIAIEAAASVERAPDGAWFIDLAPVRDGSFIAEKLTAALPSLLGGAGDNVDAIAARLAPHRLLLIFDNCEHILTHAASFVATILRACPHIKVLATSRQRLSIRGEALFHLPSMSDSASTELFIARAASIVPEFVFTEQSLDIVADICRNLDGIPLAIELAVARLATFDLATLRARLRERPIIAGAGCDQPTRHETMASTIEWSYKLLQPSEALLLRRLAIFAGSFPFEGAESICTDEHLRSEDVVESLVSLVEKSLINIVANEDRVRYYLLDSVRGYALEQLTATDEVDTISRHHASWFADFATHAESGRARLTRRAWLALVWPEIDNIRVALEWSLSASAPTDAVLGARIAGGLRGLWQFSGRLVEGRHWAKAALARVDEAVYPRETSAVLQALISFSHGSEVFAANDRALALFESLGDRRGLAWIHQNATYELAQRRRFVEAERSAAIAEQLLREIGLEHTPLHASLLVSRTKLHFTQGRFDEARADIREAEAIATALGDELFVLTWCYTHGAENEFCAGNRDTAIEIARRMVSSEMATAGSLLYRTGLYLTAAFQVCSGQPVVAEDTAQTALRNSEFEDECASASIRVLAAAAAVGGDGIRAATLLGFVEAWCESVGYVAGPLEQRVHSVATVALNAQLSDSTVDRLKADGRGLSLERATIEALRPSRISHDEANMRMSKRHGDIGIFS